MPEVQHKDQPSIAAPVPSVPKVEVALAGVTTSDLEKAVSKLLTQRRQEAAANAAPKEPDWANMTERDAQNPNINIPVIDHDIPDYMNIVLKDKEYMPVWASRDQRRLGQLLAEGYEFITPDMMAVEFKAPLLFNSDKQYIYHDVIAMRAHKRIVFGKQRKALELSRKQLQNAHNIPKVKSQIESSGDIDFDLGEGMNVYDTR